MKKIILVTHVLSDGPAQNFLKYCLNNKFEIIYIEHPLIVNKRIQSSRFKIFNGKKIIFEKTLSKIKSVFFSHFLSIFRNVFLVRKYFNKKNDYYIGFNCLNTLSGIILKKYLKFPIDKVIFFSVDYSPKRYQIFILNYIYQFLDKFCIKNSDYSWCLSQKMINEKKLIHNLKDSYDHKFKISPMGYWNIYKIDRKFEYNFLYIGNIEYQQGLNKYLELAKVLKKNKIFFKFNFIGDGADLDLFKKDLYNCNLLDSFIFHGYLKDFDNIINISKKTSFGLAIYETSQDPMKLINYTDSGKIKMYISLNLPFITNYEISNWKFYKKKNCSLIESNVDDIFKKLKDLDFDNTLYSKICRNITKLENEFLWNNIIKKLIV